MSTGCLQQYNWRDVFSSTIGALRLAVSLWVICGGHGQPSTHERHELDTNQGSRSEMMTLGVPCRQKMRSKDDASNICISLLKLKSSIADRTKALEGLCWPPSCRTMQLLARQVCPRAFVRHTFQRPAQSSLKLRAIGISHGGCLHPTRQQIG